MDSLPLLQRHGIGEPVMIYEAKEGFISVKWKKTEIGRIYNEGGLWHYRPRGCGGVIRSENFNSLQTLTDYLEGKK